VCFLVSADDYEGAATTLVKVDVVEEYNKAVEMWFNNTAPPLAELHRILRVTSFHVSVL
jgi:hypothetical protein